MSGDREEKNLLGPYRVLDLSDEKGFLCGRILADLGADVIKIERPGGDPGRRIGPFYHDDPDPEKSLYWFAYNANKRGITLDIESSDGREIFKRLIESADVVIESFKPGFMSSLGLGYQDLEKINQRIVLVSITPFGQSGPYVERDYKVNDLVIWALSGFMFQCGDPDRPPVQFSFPQAYLHGSAEAATAAVTALYARELIGAGQHIDVSIQECLNVCGANAMQYWDLYRINLERGMDQKGRRRADGTVLARKRMYYCKDGLVFGFLEGGALKAFSSSSAELVKWMNEDGQAGDLIDYDWTAQNSASVSQEEVNRTQEVASVFFKKHTKAEIYEEAIKRKLVFAPIQSAKDVAHSPQLAGREYFTQMEHPDLGDTLTYCGPFAKISDTPLNMRRPAPLIGEHNYEIYGKELGMTRKQILTLKKGHII